MENNNYSIWRNTEYKEISKLNFRGKVLDLGGSKRSGYQELVGDNCQIVTVNIDKEFGCDLVFDIQEKFPLADQLFDMVICVNVLEHIFNFRNVLSESYRVLKDGGELILFTPFIFQIHGSPDDYFRYTKSALNKLCEENNFTNIEIKEIGLGVFSLFFQILGGAIPNKFLRRQIQKFSVTLDSFLLKISKSYRKLCLRIPIGYMTRAKK